MSDFFKESDCDSTGYYSANDVRTAGPTISLGGANALIKERSTVVYGAIHNKDRFGWQMHEKQTEEYKRYDTHTALLINIEPIERDSAEKIVEDLASLGPVDFKSKDFIELFDRARKLRGKK